MFLPFNLLPQDARIWIYQANRELSQEELTEINHRLQQFLESWTAHGKHLKAGFIIKYHRFIVVGLNEEFNEASGCSIDKLVHCIQTLEQSYKVSLLDKLNVTYRQQGKILYKPLSEFKKLVKQKLITKQTVVFNNLVNTVTEFNEHWEVPAEQSWHHRFFK